METTVLKDNSSYASMRPSETTDGNQMETTVLKDNSSYASMRPSETTDGNMSSATDAATAETGAASMRPSETTDGNIQVSTVPPLLACVCFNEAVGNYRRKPEHANV